MLRRINKDFFRRSVARPLEWGAAKYSILAASSAVNSHRQSSNGRRTSNSWLVGITGIVSVTAAFSMSSAECKERDPHSGVAFETEQVLTNWSGTHTCKPKRVYEPHSAQEVARLLQYAYKTKSRERFRPIGTALSPNGLGFSDDNLVSLAAIDYVHVDAANRLVTVGAGARVSDVLRALDQEGLTLQNFSSIQEQQMAGWTQVAAHGTGATLATVDDMIVRMQVATPTEGLLTLSREQNANLFSFAKVALGSLGIVTELTLQCIPKHRLHEHTYSVPVTDIQKGHYERLRHYRHLRYMWLPHTDQVTVVVSNPIDGLVADVKTTDPAAEIVKNYQATAQKGGTTTATLATQPLLDLYVKLKPETPMSSIERFTFAQLRDMLLAIAPLDAKHVKAVNQAEAEFWKRSTGSRIDDSINVLGFDCGGEQLVFEVAFPIGSLAEQTGKDIEMVQRILKKIQELGIAAPSPIEQRWTSRSTSPLSPAYSTREDDVFSWVGIIMYLPAGKSDAERAEIRQAFHTYVQSLQPLFAEYKAHAHWAKLEVDYTPMDAAPASSSSSWWNYLMGGSSNSSNSTTQSAPPTSTVTGNTISTSSSVDRKKRPDTITAASLLEHVQRTPLQARVASRYPVQQFNEYRRALDPRGILSNDFINAVFGDVSKR